MEGLSVSKKKVSIFFIPSISGESFLLIALFVILTPLMILGLITQFIGMTIGPFIEPIVKSYSSLVLLPMIFVIKPESLATGFGSKPMDEAQIQTFFDEAVKSISNTQFLYMNLIFALLMLVLVLIYYYKNGIKKGIFRWIGRYIVLNILITIPLWGYLIEKLITVDVNSLINAHYLKIYAAMQQQVKTSYVILIITVLLVTISMQFMILFVGKNYHERKLKWIERKNKKEEKKNEKINRRKNREIEYY